MNLVARVFILVIVGFSFNCLSLKAQTDSVNLRLQAAKAITNRFPSTRFFNVEYEYLTPVDYKTELSNQPLENGRLENQNRIKINLNVPIYKKNKWAFTGSLRYKYNYSELGQMENVSTEYPDISHGNSQENHTFNMALNSTYISKVFNKPIIYNVGIVSDGSQKGFERISGLGIATMVLKRNQNMTMTAGLVVIVDKMARIPAFPLFGLDYNLSNSWQFTFAFPQYIYFRKTFFNNGGRLSLGTNLDGGSYYVYPVGIDNTLLYNKTEIKTGLIYEHYLQKRFILNIRGGMFNSLEGKLLRKNESHNDRSITSTQGVGAYFNIGVSYNLF